MSLTELNTVVAYRDSMQSMMKTQAQIYRGETEIRDADGLSNPVTGDRYDFEVIGEIIT